MGGLYSFTVQAIQGLQRNWWGAKIPTEYQVDGQGNVTPVENGAQTDSGVQPFVNELIARLQSNEPIQMADTADLIAPPNGAALNIVANSDGDSITIVDNETNVTIDVLEEINNITVDVENVALTVNNITNDITVINETIDPLTSGFTGTVTVITGVTFSGTVSGCTVTITPSFTTKTLTFVNGVVTGVA